MLTASITSGLLCIRSTADHDRKHVLIVVKSYDLIRVLCEFDQLCTKDTLTIVLSTFKPTYICKKENVGDPKLRPRMIEEMEKHAKSFFVDSIPQVELDKQDADIVIDTSETFDLKPDAYTSIVVHGDNYTFPIPEIVSGGIFYGIAPEGKVHTISWRERDECEYCSNVIHTGDNSLLYKEAADMLRGLGRKYVDNPFDWGAPGEQTFMRSCEKIE